MAFFLSQDPITTPPPVIGNPTNPANPLPTPVIPPSTGFDPNAALPFDPLLVFVIAGIVGFLIILWFWMDKGSKLTYEDVRPSARDMIDLESGMEAYNRMYLIQTFYLFGVLTASLYLMGLGTWLMLLTGASILMIGIVGFGFFYFWKKTKVLEITRNKKNLDGKYVSLHGEYEKYHFSDFKVANERTLTKTEIIEISEDNPNWKKKTLKNLQALPFTCTKKGKTYSSYILSKNNPDNWSWVDGLEINAFGEQVLSEASPVLLEIANLHRVIPDKSEKAMNRDVYVPVFVVLFDSIDAMRYLADIDYVDITTNDVLSALTKAIGAEERTTAGELNSTTAAMLAAQNDIRNFDVMVGNRSAAMAASLEHDKDILKRIGAMTSGFNWNYILYIVIAIVCYYFGTVNGVNSVLMGGG